MERAGAEVFEKLPVGQAVRRQIVPSVVSQMVTLIYSLADTYFVGLLNEPRQSAAITLVYPSFVMLTAVSNLFGVGGASLIAQRLGKNEEEDAREISSVAFWLGLGVAVFFALLFFCLARPVLTLCGAAEETFPMAYGYALWVIVLGGPFVILNSLLANLLRAEGHAGEASFGISTGGILNTILDPFFILPVFFGFGAAGAGMATALSNLLSTCYFIFMIWRKRKTSVITIAPAYLRLARVHVKPLLAMGMPSALQYALTVAAIGAQSAFVAKYATEATAALGIVKKLDQLPLYFSIGVANGLLPLLAYNDTAGNKERRRKAFALGASVSLGFSLCCLVLYEVFAPQLSGLFIADALTIEYSSAFLRRMVTAMPFMAVCYPMVVQFQAMGRTREALAISVLRKGVLDLPLLFLLDRALPLFGCMWVQPIVDFVSLIAAAGLYIRLKKNGKA